VTVRLAFSVTQRKAGAPLRNIRAVLSFDLAVDTVGVPYLGVTTTATVPATVAALAHFDQLTVYGEDAFCDRAQFPARPVFANGLQLSASEVDTYLKTELPLDGDYAAGRYLWLLAIVGDTGSGATPIDQHTAAYLIR
jgi:hypothetical protein